MTAPKRRQQGFTLLEVLIALSLTALLLSMLSAGVYTVVTDWERDTAVLDESLDTSLIVVQIERALFAAFPHSFIDREEIDRFVYFEGGPESLSWVSTVSPYRVDGLTAWQLSSSRDDGLQLRLAPAYSDDPTTRLEEASLSDLLPRYRARFQYLMQRNPEEKEWVDEWPGREMQSLPRAVHIELIPIDDERDPPLEILAPIRSWQHEDIQPTIPVI